MRKTEAAIAPERTPGRDGFADLTAGLRVIDCDTHFTEPPDLWTSRAPTSMKDRVLRVQRVDGVDRWVVGEDIDFGPIGSTVIDREGRKVLGKLGLESFADLRGPRSARGATTGPVLARHFRRTIRGRIEFWAGTGGLYVRLRRRAAGGSD